jgi:hypothetical protein
MTIIITRTYIHISTITIGITCIRYIYILSMVTTIMIIITTIT